MNLMYDLAIIGGGPAGVAAGVYASRKRLRTVFITKDFGGQSSVSADIQNWIGTTSISGEALAKNLENHLKVYAGDVVDIKAGELCQSIEKLPDDNFKIVTDNGEYSAKSVLITTGSSRRRLEAKNADKFEHKGITYCASCDGPLFAGLDVAVVGGGNAGLETAAQLLAYAKSVTLLHRREELKADPVTVKKVLEHPNMHTILNVEILEVTGDKFVTGLVYKDKMTNDQKTLPVQGIFVEVGSIPMTDFAKDVVNRNEFNQIEIDPWTQKTSTEGIWAAGDCTNVLYHQNNIAAGDAVRALEDIYMYIHTRK